MTNSTEGTDYERQGLAACHAATVWIGTDLTSLQAYVAYTYLLMFAAFCCCCCFSRRGKVSILSRVDRLNQLIAEEESDAKRAEEKRVGTQPPRLDGHLNELLHDVEVAESEAESAREPMGSTSPRPTQLHLRDVVEPRSMSPGVRRSASRTPPRISADNGSDSSGIAASRPSMPIDVCEVLADVYETGRSAAMGTSSSSDSQRKILTNTATLTNAATLTSAENFALKRAANREMEVTIPDQFAARWRSGARSDRQDAHPGTTFCSVATAATANSKKKLQVPSSRTAGMKLQHPSPRAQDAPNASSRKSRPLRAYSRGSSAEHSA